MCFCACFCVLFSGLEANNVSVVGEEFSIRRNYARKVVSGNILASTQGGVGYLQPRGHVSSSSRSIYIRNYDVRHLIPKVCSAVLKNGAEILIASIVK